jgi:nicotinic acid mononucleotide adenylyltransferase
VGAIEVRLLSREMLDYAVRQCERAIRERLAEWRREGETPTLDSLRDRRATLKAQAARLAEAIGVGGDMSSLLERLREVEKQVAEVERTIVAYRPRDLDLKAEQIRELVLKAILQLRKVLDEGDVQRARSALSKHVGRLVLTPTL